MDKNGCANISAGTVTANLSSLGLSSTTPLVFSGGSCQSDGNTVIFQKTGITTLASLGTYSFSNPANFTATDADGNVNQPSDSNFGSEDYTTAASLSVIAATAPQVGVSAPSNPYFG